MASMYQNMIKQILPHIKTKYFQAPLIQSNETYFPDFLCESLNNYLAFYQNNLVKHIDQKISFDSQRTDIVVSKIKSLNESINKAVELFYEGKILEATTTFNKSLDKILFDDVQLISKIPVETNFYRSRTNGTRHYSKADLFHVKFELRHIVSTNRYSVPGFPALYLGDTTYVCWEEFNRHKLKDLWFSRISNTRALKIILIQRIEDFLNELNQINSDLQLTFLLRYLITFPLTISCSVKVKHPDGNFKPEYIIPQMLLQYISKKEDIDGIKFMSTKVDYNKLHEVEAYNYVFPVKTIHKKGFCNRLTDIFHSTEPTSLEMEEILYNPTTHPMVVNSGTPSDNRQIELIDNLKSYYSSTSFGKIETSLMQRQLSKI